MERKSLKYKKYQTITSKMAIRLSNTDTDYNQIITDSDDKAVTSYDYVRDMYSKKSFFEACVCQSIFLEAICLYYLIIKKSEKSLEFTIKEENKLKESRLTFGQTKDIILKYELLTEESLIKILKNYVTDRNILIHKLVGEMRKVDFEKLYKEGEKLLFQLWKIILDYTKEKRRRAR